MNRLPLASSTGAFAIAMAWSPPGRQNLGTAYHSATKQLIIFGGTTITGGADSFFNDTWSLVQQP
jgi:hypothetical protein